MLYSAGCDGTMMTFENVGILKEAIGIRTKRTRKTTKNVSHDSRKSTKIRNGYLTNMSRVLQLGTNSYRDVHNGWTSLCCLHI